MEVLLGPLVGSGGRCRCTLYIYIILCVCLYLGKNIFKPSRCVRGTFSDAQLLACIFVSLMVFFLNEPTRDEQCIDVVKPLHG